MPDWVRAVVVDVAVMMLLGYGAVRLVVGVVLWLEARHVERKYPR